MAKKIIFQDYFFISGIMCHEGCGFTIQDCLNDCFKNYQKQGYFKNAKLSIDAEPQSYGIHCLYLTIEDDEAEPEIDSKTLSDAFRNSLNSTSFKIIEANTNQEEEATYINWINIGINVLAIAIILFFSLLLPPSWPLTLGLTAFTFATTAFTARSYLIHFFQNLRHNNLANMTTTISIGWFLSLVHTLYHSMTMVLISSLSMTFMGFIMPILLISFINGMDEIKRLILKKSEKIHLKGMNHLFPKMSKEYPCYEISEQEQLLLTKFLKGDKSNADTPLESLQGILNQNPFILQKKQAIKEGMLIQIGQDECIPVDCILVQGNTLVDSSLQTGKIQERKQCMDIIPAGSINLGQPIVVYATTDSYNSTINKLLFRANRNIAPNTIPAQQKFVYLYIALILIGALASIAVPYAIGGLTVALVLQNLTGILFAICPCTVAIAHQLPSLLSMYHRNQKGVGIRDERLFNHFEEIHTIIFDKTGTLTTGNSLVESFEGISPSLWERIYLLESQYGRGHPLARALIQYFETQVHHHSLIQDVTQAMPDPKNRGLSAMVQGKLIHLGNSDYLKQSGISLPELDTHKISQGFTPVYVAQDRVYQGVIYLKHEIRKGLLEALAQLPEQVELIMLTGDNELTARGFNQQNGSFFKSENIHAGQTPQDKDDFLKTLMNSGDKPKAGYRFIGDGLNDTLSAKTVTEEGGISCAITSNDKSASFTDISLNGSIQYLSVHEQLNYFLKKNILQNKWILGYGVVSFLAFIFCFSILGIAVSAIIPLTVMTSTTLMVLFNSYRVALSIDNAMDAESSWLKQFLASDVSLALLISSHILFLCGLGFTTTGVTSIPGLAFASSFITLCSPYLIPVGATISLILILSCLALAISQNFQAFPNCFEGNESGEEAEYDLEQGQSAQDSMQLSNPTPAAADSPKGTRAFWDRNSQKQATPKQQEQPQLSDQDDCLPDSPRC